MIDVNQIRNDQLQQQGCEIRDGRARYIDAHNADLRAMAMTVAGMMALPNAPSRCFIDV
jgi:hypothetical protein